MIAAQPRAKILIVDDEPINIHVLSEALQGVHDLRFATSGEQALAMLELYTPDLILMDVVMPKFNGFETLARLRNNPGMAEIPVIFVTAMSETGDEEKGFELGAVDYITKPISAAIVRARVRTHLQLKRQRDLLERGAFVDGLTNIANRRRFDQVLAARWGAALRGASELTLMLVDVDHFKQFNDHYGHVAGDDSLRQVAMAMDQAFTCGEDLVARYGGEEFGLILGGGSIKGHALRLLRTICELQIQHEHSSAGSVVTASVGAVAVVPAMHLTMDDAVSTVDALLYQAKQAGRNCCAYTAEGEVAQILRPDRRVD